MRTDDEAVRRLMEVALQLEGLYRHASTHAAGLVIGDRPLVELVPLYRDPKSDTLVTQYSMKYVEQAGLVKFDFLGLTTLTILQRALAYMTNPPDLDRLPLDDTPTFEMLAKGDAGGVFQFESAGMRDVLRQMRPDRFEDLIAAVALFRPGPMANIPDYCRRKHGEAWEAPHPELDSILGETYGIMVYQEQVMQIAQTMGGYSLGSADLLRRAMGKKIRAEMDSQRQTFVDGATARGIPEAKAVEVFELMAKFADYGFNKSHAAAYALVAYQTAWMKRNHPVEFLAACMSLAINNTDKLAALRQEAERLGIRVLPPDINRSGADFTVDQDTEGKPAIRYALAAVKKVGMAAMVSLVAARGGNPFRDVTDLASRVDPRQLNKMQIENLARAGAMDCIGANRAQLFAGAESVLRRAQADAEQKESGPDRPVRWRSARADPSAHHARLAGFGAAGVRGRGDRVPSDGPSAGYVCRLASPAGCDWVHQIGKPRRIRVDPSEAGRLRDRPEGAADAQWQQDGLGAPVGRGRQLRGDLLLRSPGRVWRSAAGWCADPGDGGFEAGGGKLSASPRPRPCRWSRRPRRRGPVSASGSARPPQCRISGPSWTASARERDE